MVSRGQFPKLHQVELRLSPISWSVGMTLLDPTIDPNAVRQRRTGADKRPPKRLVSSNGNSPADLYGQPKLSSKNISTRATRKDVASTPSDAKNHRAEHVCGVAMPVIALNSGFASFSAAATHRARQNVLNCGLLAAMSLTVRWNSVVIAPMIVLTDVAAA